VEKTIYLKLYGQIKHEDDLGKMAWQLYQSKAMTRLRDVSLSSVPSRFTPDSMAASRFEHSVGVGHLARILARTRSELSDDEADLLASALLHDVGSPPFSHISEIFFWDLSGKTHEEETSSLLQPGSELEKILKKDGIDARRIVRIINGQDEKLGPLISGSIDLDNIDNSLHLLLSLGYNNKAPYQPEELLRAFRIHNKEITLDSKYLKEIIGWQECRVLLYDALHKDPSLSAASMLYRALEYAYRGNYLDHSFFRLSESDALYFLLHQSSGKSEKIIKRLLRWKHYPLIYQTLTEKEDPRLASLYSNWQGKKAVADRIAKELNVAPEDVAFYIGRDRGEKEIHLPFSGKNSADVARLFRGQKGKQRLAVFLKKEHQSKKHERKVKQIIQEIKEGLPEGTSEHIFF
jgi:HD superfamily phosphohydrolase